MRKFIITNLSKGAVSISSQQLVEVGDGNGESGGGAVDSVNGQTGVVVLDADNIAETATRKWVSLTEKTTWNGKEDKIFDINDSTLSAGVSSTTNVLIKTYDIGFLSGFKTVYVETLGFKSVIASGDFRFTIFLKEKLTATNYLLATSSGAATSQHVVSVLRFAIDEPAGLIRLLNPSLNTPTYLGNAVSNVSTYTIDFTKEYEIQIFLRVGDVAVEAKQYFNQIRKR